MSIMGFGWFGFSTFWLVPLVWRMVARALAGERRLFGPGTLRVWLGTLVVLCASASLEALTSLSDVGEAGEAVMTAGGSAGRALAGLSTSLLGWTGSLLLMLGVLALAAPMVFGETWRGLFQSRKPAAVARSAEVEQPDVPHAMSQAPSPREPESWETTSLNAGPGGTWSAPSPRHKGIEAVSARRQPAWQPPPRTRQSPPQPGEIWLHHADAPGPVQAAPAPTAAAATPTAIKPVQQPKKPAPAPTPNSAPKTSATPTPARAQSAPPRATVVSSPFHQPQLGLRSMITTLPEANAAAATTAAATAAATAVAVEPAGGLAEMPATLEATQAVETVAQADRVSEADNAVDTTPVAESGQDREGSEGSAPAAEMPDTTPSPEAEAALEAIRQEALTLLAELQALARQSALPREADALAVETAEVLDGVETPEPVAAAEATWEEPGSQAAVELAAEPAWAAVTDGTTNSAFDAGEPPVVPTDAAPEFMQDEPASAAADVAAIDAASVVDTVATSSIVADEAVASIASAIQDAAISEISDASESESEQDGDEEAADHAVGVDAATVLDANTLIQPPAAPKPRIVLPAVVGKTVPLQGAQAVAAPSPTLAPVSAPVAAATPPAPPRVVDYRLPGADLLEPPDDKTEQVSEERLQETGSLIEQRLSEFKVPVSVVGASAGPVITRFEVDPAMGVRGAQVVGLMKDLARALGVTSIRVVETIPGKTCMGLELPNARREMIRLSEIVSAASFRAHNSRLVLAMGKDITGNPVVTDLARAPHLLVAGTTGSGKSVAVNAMILSMLYKATPEDVRLIMIDPKMLELSVYEGIPHLLAPVVTDMKQAAHALNWCVGEMEKRYRLMSALGVRNLAGFNQKIRAAEAAEQKVPNPFSLTPDAPEPLSTLPLIVVVIDELADLMMVAGKKIEELIARLAQKARAAGIHLILATQRPSVDVITGLIKANIPTRVAFQVSSKIDSRTILDQMGAESLLGQGDMLFLPPGTGYPQRVHGAFVADDEVHRVVEHWKQFGEPDYDENILAGEPAEASGDLFGDGGGDGESDPLYDDAAAFVLNTRRASISAVQRQLRIGYNRAARLIEQMEAAGLVSSMGRNGARDVLAPGPSD